MEILLLRVLKTVNGLKNIVMGNVTEEVLHLTSTPLSIIPTK
jgi:nucleotide-binding universal stress UspA family protein